MRGAAAAPAFGPPRALGSPLGTRNSLATLTAPMARHLLDNATRWDFETRCFVCEPRNEQGLGVSFYHDDEAHRIVAEFTPQAYHPGAPQVMHGGISMSLLDEGM